MLCMHVLENLSPLQQLRAPRLARRLIQLTVGLVLYGASMAMMLRSYLGLMPWDVFHYGVARWLPLSFGGVVIATGLVVLVLWIPLRQAPGLGTIANAVVIGLATDATLSFLGRPDALAGRIALMLGGVMLNAFASALYIGAQLGPGPRDGLMTGVVRRTGWSVRLVRTAIEVTVIVVGFVLGGTVGIGTALYALGVGPLIQVFLPLCVVSLSIGSAVHAGDHHGRGVDDLLGSDGERAVEPGGHDLGHSADEQQAEHLPGFGRPVLEPVEHPGLLGRPVGEVTQ